MSNLYKFFYFLWVFLLTINSISANKVDLNIKSINIIDQKNLDIKLDNKISSNNENIEWDIKLFKYLDNKVLSNIDGNSTKQISIELSDSLKKNTSYTILSLDGTSWDMDFDLSSSFVWKEIVNKNKEGQSIDKIFISNDKNITISYKSDIDASDTDINLLENIEINKVKLNLQDKSIIDLNLKSSLDSNREYIVMSYNLKSKDNWDEYMFWSQIFDFKTNNFEVNLNLNSASNSWNIQNQNRLLNKNNTWSISWTGAFLIDKATKTPWAWTETNILIILSIIFSLFFFFRKTIKYSK